MKQSILISVCLMLFLGANAQTPQRQGWGQRNQQQQNAPKRSGEFSAAEYWTHQTEFLTKAADLSEEEAKAFFPVYGELQHQKRELNRNLRQQLRQAGPEMNEEQSAKAIDAMADNKIKIAELEKEYLAKFKKILPASKIRKVLDAEEQFNSQMLKDIQQSRGHQFQQNQQKPRQQQVGQAPSQPVWPGPEKK